ncbi:MAG: hypothetical protein CMO81_11110 [Waddliaceae bacterium]|nr:hypothetical protein [Waddliaceae bacterium]
MSIEFPTVLPDLGWIAPTPIFGAQDYTATGDPSLSDTLNEWMKTAAKTLLWGGGSVVFAGGLYATKDIWVPITTTLITVVGMPLVFNCTRKVFNGKPVKREQTPPIINITLARPNGENVTELALPSNSSNPVKAQTQTPKEQVETGGGRIPLVPWYEINDGWPSGDPCHGYHYRLQEPASHELPMGETPESMREYSHGQGRGTLTENPNDEFDFGPSIPGSLI